LEHDVRSDRRAFDHNAMIDAVAGTRAVEHPSHSELRPGIPPAVASHTGAHRSIRSGGVSVSHSRQATARSARTVAELLPTSTVSSGRTRPRGGFFVFGESEREHALADRVTQGGRQRSRTPCVRPRAR
jgi:hypothetical protein